MNRIIKFRVWDKKNDQFLPFKGSPMLSLMVVYREYGFNETDFIFQQFTGLKDKNGKEIYEGDIIENKTKENKWNPSPVSWDGYGWAILNTKDNSIPIALADSWTRKHSEKNNIQFSELEIIGNIFENPELIK